MASEPSPDGLHGGCPDARPGPEARYGARESISLVFVAALQYLPPRQRAALILRDVLGFPAVTAATILDRSVEAVDSDLERARAVFAGRLPPGAGDRSPPPDSPREREVVARFASAFERGDADGIVALLTGDAWLTMPPFPFAYRGAAAARFLTVSVFGNGTRRFRLVATRANGQPAFGCYLRDPAALVARAHGLIVLTLAADRVCAITSFFDESMLLLFALPSTLPDD
jgi:RNA polymerase sigma-70 factor (TIGR02960 family)